MVLMVCGSATAGQERVLGVEVLAHGWKPTETWDRIGKTRFAWEAQVKNHSDRPLRVFVYYDLLSREGFPLARNVMNEIVPAGAVRLIRGDSYIETPYLPYVTESRAVAKPRPLH